MRRRSRRDCFFAAVPQVPCDGAPEGVVCGLRNFLVRVFIHGWSGSAAIILITFEGMEWVLGKRFHLKRKVQYVFPNVLPLRLNLHEEFCFVTLFMRLHIAARLLCFCFPAEQREHGRRCSHAITLFASAALDCPYMSGYVQCRYSGHNPIIAYVHANNTYTHMCIYVCMCVLYR